MRFFVFIKDGEVDGHPYMEDNLLDTLPGFDPDKLPDNMMEINRVPPPTPSNNFVHMFVRYIIRDNTVIEEYYEVPYTEIEKRDLLNELVLNTNRPAGWIFDRETGDWVYPFPPPDPSENYDWDNDKLDWVLIN